MRKTILLLLLLVLVSGCINIDIDKAADERKEPVSSEGQKGVPAKTEIKIRGESLEMVISPSQDKTIKDLVTITATKAPSDTSTVGFGIIGPGIEPLEKTGPNLGYDKDGSDGWSLDFDTNSYPNGIYTLAVIAFPTEKERQSGKPPLGSAQVKVEIQNAEFFPVPSPLVTAPYKVIPGSCSNPLQSIEDAKKLNANTISMVAFAGPMDNTGAAVWEPPEKRAKGCAKLIAMAHENSMKTMFSVSLANEEDIVVEEFHFDRAKFLQTYKEMLKSYAAFAQENKVSIFVIATEIDTLAGIDDVGKPAGVPRLKPNEKGSLSYDASKEFIKEARDVYSGKIAIGFVGLDYDEPEAPYYPFEGADIVCFSGSEAREGQVEESIQHMRMKAALVKKTGQKVGINEVILCEVYFLPKSVRLLFTSTSTSAGLKELIEKQSSFYKASFQEEEKEFFRRLISEVGPKISGLIVSWGYSGPITVRGRLSEKTIAEEFAKWK